MKEEKVEKTTEVIDEGCAGSCETCGGCGSIDPETLIQILGSRNQELEDKYMR